MRQAIGMIGREDSQNALDWIQSLPSTELQTAASEALFELQNRSKR
jgi:hypothetical protein